MTLFFRVSRDRSQPTGRGKRDVTKQRKREGGGGKRESFLCRYQKHSKSPNISGCNAYAVCTCEGKLYSGRCLWCNVSQCLTLNILSGIKESAEASGFQTDELHVKSEGGVGWDDPWVSFEAIGEVWRADQLGPLANTHLRWRWQGFKICHLKIL